MNPQPKAMDSPIMMEIKNIIANRIKGNRIKPNQVPIVIDFNDDIASVYRQIGFGRMASPNG
ncbi:hypothetical protein [Acinetobacter sp. CFCC 10889]|uniref:hypothetical protein n=1 Tax=Acinetobacter sp. CFCC 10889 TaxID=1775557 RepID=UPI0013A70A4C|nr:hypothetical protein [Acinetobacter sp. CFCC 10889]